MRFTALFVAAAVSAALVGCGTLKSANARPAAACAVPSSGLSRAPIFSRTAGADPSVVAHLAALRRGQQASDLPAALRRGLAHQLLRRVALRGIRYVGQTITGERFYLVPATVAPAQCPPSGPLTPAQRRRFRALDRQIAIRTHRFGLALVPLGPGQAGGTAYSPGSLLPDITNNHLIALFDAADGRTSTLAGAVPDGVSTIHVTYNAQTITIGVARGSNFWSAQVSGSIPDAHARFVWSDANGRVIRRFVGIAEAQY